MFCSCFLARVFTSSGDTTVQALTLSPSLKDGRVFYEDSALVRSVTLGRVLVIDEADKAPLEVVAVLKGLVQDGEMDLADGRKIVHALPKNLSEREASRFIPIHPDFKLIVLANRPGSERVVGRCELRMRGVLRCVPPLLSWSDMVGWLACSLLVLLVDVSASFVFLRFFVFFCFSNSSSQSPFPRKHHISHCAWKR